MAQDAVAQGMLGIIEDLPTLLMLSDYVFYIVGILFFGSIVMYGFRGQANIVVRFGLRVLMGLISMVGGVALKGLFPQFSSGIYQLLNVDMLVGSLISSIVVAVGIYLISFRLINVRSLEKKISNMEKLIKKAKHVPSEKLGFRDPVKVGGIIIIIAFVSFSLVNFSGFPRASDRLLSSMGLNIDDLKGIQQQLGDIRDMEGELPAGCDSILSILQVVGPDINSLPESSDKSVLSLLNEGSTESVLAVKELVYHEKDYFIGITETGSICHATREVFCSCLNP